MPRTGLKLNEVHDMALKIVSKKGMSALTIHELAHRLKIKPPSLYNHVKGLPALKLQISSKATVEITAALRQAIEGKSGKEALKVFAMSYRAFALSKPGLYEVSCIFPKPNSKEWPNYMKLKELFLKTIADSLNMSDENALISLRILRSFIHGFVTFELNDGWSNIMDPNKTYEQALDQIITGLAAIKTE